MKKRLLWLFVLSAALFLMMGLMVATAQEAPRDVPVERGMPPLLPLPQEMLPQFGGMPQSGSLSVCTNRAAHVNEIRINVPFLQADANGLPLQNRCYYRAAYGAVRLEDSAG